MELEWWHDLARAPAPAASAALSPLEMLEQMEGHNASGARHLIAKRWRPAAADFAAAMRLSARCGGGPALSAEREAERRALTADAAHQLAAAELKLAAASALAPARADARARCVKACHSSLLSA